LLDKLPVDDIDALADELFEDGEELIEELINEPELDGLLNWLVKLLAILDGDKFDEDELLELNVLEKSNFFFLNFFLLRRTVGLISGVDDRNFVSSSPLF
jgi:hypothetical protein